MIRTWIKTKKTKICGDEMMSGVKKKGALLQSSIRSLPAKFSSLPRRQQMGVFLLCVVILMATWYVWFYYQISKPSDLFNGVPDDFKGEDFDWDAWDVESYFDQNIVNVVLLGFDQNESRAEEASTFLTDSIKVVSINFDKGQASIINIPRDIYVKIADTDIMDKINHAYYYGTRYGKGDDRHQNGIAYSLKSISNVLGGIPLKYYVTVDMDGVIELVDSIGGVEFTVEEDVYFKGRIWVEKGHQVLDGVKYLRYLRSREDGGDVGRVNRQTELLLATLDHFNNQGLFKQIPTLYNVYDDLLDTNLSNKQIVSMALYARNLKKDDIHTHTITGSNQFRNGIYYMVMNQSKRSDIIKAVFGLDFPEQPSEQLTDTIPAPPKALAGDYLLNASGQRGLLLTWSSGDRFNIEYNLYRRLNSGDDELIAQGLEEEKYWDTDVIRGSVYHYRLEAVNRRVVSESVHLEKEINEERPLKPVGFQASSHAGQVSFTWNAGDQKTVGFRLVRKSSNTPDKLLLDNVLTYEFQDDNLSPGEYTYHLVAVDSGGFFSEAFTLRVVLEGEPGTQDPPDPDDDTEEP